MRRVRESWILLYRPYGMRQTPFESGIFVFDEMLNTAKKQKTSHRDVYGKDARSPLQLET